MTVPIPTRWLPIEMAPRLEPVLIYDPAEAHPVVAMLTPTCWQVLFCSSQLFAPHPTHWMPLPEPPHAE